MRRIIGPTAFIFCLTLMVYWPCLRGDFLWDDDVLLTANPHMHQPGGIKAIWLGQETPDYFPLTLTALWLEWRLFDLKPLGYHVVNTLWHALGAVFLWRVLLRLNVPGAFLAATLFSVHPLGVGTVAWIAEQKNTLSLVFFLLALFFYLKADGHAETSISKTPSLPGKLNRKWYGLSWFAFLLALLSKTSVVMLPVILPGCAWWQRGKISKSDLLRSAPFFLLSIIFGLVTIAFQTEHMVTNKSDPLLVRISAGGWALWFYLFKAILPVNLSMIYPRWEIQAHSLIAWLPWLLWLGTLALGWKLRHRGGRFVLFALGYFFITLLPVLGFFDMSFLAFSRVADHLVYLSIIGPIALAGAWLARGWKKPSGIRPPKEWRFNPIAIVIIGVFAGLSWSRAHVFASSEKLWNDTLKRNPKAWAAYNNLGEALAWKGDIEQSVELFRAAVRLNPEYAKAHQNLGNAHAALGRYDEAFASFEKALQIWPDYAQAENGWGLALVRQQQFDAAVIHFENALRHAPKYEDAHYNLGFALVQKGQFARAIDHYRAVLRVNPEFADAHLELGAALAGLDKFDEASVAYCEAIRLNPNAAEAYNGLGMVMARQKKVDEAAHCFREALRLDPQNAKAQRNLADLPTLEN